MGTKKLSFFLNLIFVLIFISLLTSCAKTVEPNDEEKNFNNTHTLIEDRKIVIPIDSVTRNVGAFQYFVDPIDSVKYFVLLNNYLNRLQIYDWPAGLIKQTIQVPKDSGMPTHFYIHNLDSIFLVDGHLFRLSLINSDGDLLRSYRLLDDEKDYNSVQFHPPPLATSKKYIGTPVPDNRNPIIMVNDSLFIRCYPWLDPMKKEYFEIGKLKLGINLNTNNIFYFMPYPDFIWNQNKTYPIQFYNESCTYNNIKNRFIFSFPADNYIYEVSPNGKTIEKHWAGSTYFEETKALPKRTADNIKHAEHTFNNFHFERICFDKYRNVYYRLVWHPDAKTKFSFEKPGQAFRPRLSIVILDENFNQMGETLLPKTVTNTFMFLDYEGLYIQSEVDSASQISFTLFRLKSI